MNEVLPHLGWPGVGELHSLAALHSAFPAPRFLVRPEPPPDLGVDGTIEVSPGPPDRRGAPFANLRAYFQIKRRERGRVLADGRLLERADVKTLAYLHAALRSLYFVYDAGASQFYFGWIDELADQLDARRPGWRERDGTRTVLLRPFQGERTLAEIEAEVRNHARLARHALAGPGFARELRAGGAPPPLVPVPPFVGRAAEARAIVERVGPGHLVEVVGPPEAGKTQLVAHCLSDPGMLDAIRARLTGRPGVLVVDVSAGAGERPVLHALAVALGLRRDPRLAEALDDEDDADPADPAAVLLTELLPERLQAVTPVVVLESCETAASDSARNDLAAVLASPHLRASPVVVTSRVGRLSAPETVGRRAVFPTVALGPLPPDAVADLFERLLPGAAVGAAGGAAALLADFEEARLPGVLRRAAATLVGDPEPPDEQRIALAVLDAVGSGVRVALRELGCGARPSEGGRPTTLASLAAMAILRDQAIPPGAFDTLGLPRPPLERLAELGVTRLAGRGYTLSAGAAALLRREAEATFVADTGSARTGATPGRSDDAAAVRAAIRALTAYLADGERPDSAAFADARRWLLATAPGEMELCRDLGAAALADAAHDLFLPFAADEYAALREELVGAGSPTAPGFEAAVAAAVLAARARDGRAEELTAALEAAAHSFDPGPGHLRLLNALGTAIRLGQRRFYAHRAALECRKAVLTRLSADVAEEGERAPVVRATVEWAVATALTAASLGEVAYAATALARAAAMFPALPPATTPWDARGRLWLRARIRSTEARLAARQESRVAALAEAVALAGDALEIRDHLEAEVGAGVEAWVLRAFLGASRRLIAELPSDESRRRRTAATLDRLRRVAGPEASWALSLRGQAAALLRHAAWDCADPELQRELAERGCALLEGQAVPMRDAARAGDGRALLAFARTCIALSTFASRAGDTREATRRLAAARAAARDARDAAPSAASWDVWLRAAIRTVDEPTGGGAGLAGRESAEASEAPRACLAWLEREAVRSGAHSRLAARCLEEMWRREGSVLRVARRIAERRGAAWTHLARSARERALRDAYAVRVRQTERLEGRHGPSIPLALCRVRNKAQYVRSVALQGSHDVDDASVIELFDELEGRWPGSHTLRLELGRYYLYVWDVPKAVAAFRHVLTSATDGELRRDAAAGLVEALLDAAVYAPPERQADPIAPRDVALAEARAVVEDLLGFRHLAATAAILADRVALESGGPVRWDAVDETFERVVGGPDEYLRTALANMDRLGGASEHVPRDTADALEGEFTSRSALRALGSLYLRRATLGTAPERLVEDCRRAYAAFLACATLERSFAGTELATTNFQRARAILTAALAAGVADPFVAPRDGKHSLLHLARSLADRAATLSVGSFHAIARALGREIDAALDALA